MQIRNKAIPAVYLLLIKNDRLLIIRRYNTGYQDGHYSVPSGHVDTNELPTEAMIREAKEEIGIDLNKENLKLVHVSYRPKHDETDNRVDFFFQTDTWSGEIINMEPNKCDDVKWVSLDALPENMTYTVQNAIQCVRKEIFFKELGLDFLKEKGVFIS